MIYKSAVVGKSMLQVKYDSDAQSPRDWDNLGRMVCWHSRHSLGDDHNFGDNEEFMFWLLEETIGDYEKADRKLEKLSAGINREVHRRYGDYRRTLDEEILAIAEQQFVILPLYLYDHSGITMNTTGFNCRWDSGQVGWIYVSKEDIRKEYGCKRVTKKVKEKVLNLLRSEVEVYDQYLTGDVYGFELFEIDTDAIQADGLIVAEMDTDEVEEYANSIDSCWGFFGDNFKENGLLDHIENRELVEKLN